MATLKILLTSRTRQVLSSEMDTQREFHLEVLDRDETWSLFQKTAGEIVNKDPAIATIATQVAEKCGGLPLLIVTVARSLKNSGLHAWKDTLRRLRALDGKGLTEKTYSAFEWSYNKLDSEELKSVFLLCGVVVGTSSISHITDLWKYSMGLGLLKNVNTVGEAWDALTSMIEQLKDSCLLLALESDDNRLVRMHDLVKDVALRIASRENRVLSLSSGSELKEWPDKDFCSKCSFISLKQCKIPKLPEVLHCEELTVFHLDSTTDDSSREIPSNFFKEMKKLKVLDLTGLNIPLLPPSLEFIESLRTLCLDQCTLGDVALIGKLQNLEILSLLKSKVKELPKEIGQLTRLRLLDLTDCSQLEVISPNVLSSLKRLEHLGMRNSFNRWEAGGVITSERSNANLEELKHLHQLTELQLHIPDANILPPDLFTGCKLEKFQICIGSVWKWDDVDKATNALKLQLTAIKQFDQGLKILLNRTEDLYLEGTEGVHSSIAEGLPKLKHLHIQNNVEVTDFTSIINGKVQYANLTWLAVNELNGLRFLFSSSMARGLAQLQRLQVSGCQMMEEIVSIEECDADIVDNFFFQLQGLELKDLPNLTKFFSKNYADLSNLSAGTICEEIEESNSSTNPNIVTEHFLFDNKVEFTNMKKLSIHGLPKLATIWNNQFSLESSNKLETIEVVSCDNLKSIFPASVAKSLQQLRSLKVQSCGVEEIVSKEVGVQTTPMFIFSKLTYVWFEDLPHLRSFYPGLHSSKWPSLATLGVYNCDKMTTFGVGKPEFNNFCTPNIQFLFLLEKDSFPNIEVLAFDIMDNWDSQTLHYFKKLHSLRIYAHTNSTVNSFEKLFGLEKVNGEIQPVRDGTLPPLRELYLHGMRQLMNLGNDSFGPYFPSLEILELEDCDILMNLRSSAVSFRTLKTLRVSRCKGMKYLLNFSMARSMMQLTNLEVHDCAEMIEIVATEGDSESNEIVFWVLKNLKLSALPCLRGFCSGSHIVKFPSLENLSMSDCTLLETFVNSSEDHETVIHHFLFDNKVELPSLKGLCLKGLTKLMTIWHGQLSLESFTRLKDLEVDGCGNLLSIFVPSTMERLNALETLLIKDCKSIQVVFELGGGIDVRGLQDTSGAARLRSFDCGRLVSVDINSCESLKNIFPASIARNLHELKSLEVKNSGVEEIVTKEESLQTTPKFVFPKVTKVIFYNLSQLTNFYPGIHVSSWPSLHEMRVLRCGKVNIFAEEISNFQEHIESQHPCDPILQSLFIIEKDSFPNLEILSAETAMEFSNGPLPAAAQLFSKLKLLDVCCPESKSVVFLQKLLDPEGLGPRTTSAVRSGTHQQQQLLHLKELRLVGMHKLMHLGPQEDEEDDSQSAPRIPNFPNLRILHVNGCHSLRNLRSSAISFNNLTTLQVSVCKGLQYLITHSMAKSLTQLTELEVHRCLRMVEIVGSNEDDESRNEITFRRLKHLKLTGLPRLQRFCSRNCIAEFPSLETSTMSKRLKLKIFPTHGETPQLINEVEDTDVENWERWLAADDKRKSASTE